MRKALVDVLVDDVGFVQHEVALDEHRHLVVRIHHGEVLGLVVEVDVDDLKIHPFLVQHDPAALTEGVGGPRIERHHGLLLLARSRQMGAFCLNATTGRRYPAGVARASCAASERPSSTRASSSTHSRTARKGTAARRARGSRACSCSARPYTKE